MTKYTFLVYHKHYLAFLERLKDIGVLHIIEKPDGAADNEELRRKMQTAAQVKTALRKLEFYRPKNAVLAPANNQYEGLRALAEVENALAAKETLANRLALTEKEFERMEIWGRFSHERLTELQKAGFALRFFVCPLKKFNPEWEINYNAFEIEQTGSQLYFVTITRQNQTVDIEADAITLSNKTAEQLDKEITEIHSEIKRNNAEIADLSVSHFNMLKEVEANVLTAAAFDRALLNTREEADNKVKLLEGWCPDGSENELNSYLESSGIYYETAEPEEDEKVPVKLKNNRFVQMFEFIGELYDLPNYHERDLTSLFAPFYMIFFGLCLGDAGYGLLLVALGLFAKSKVKNPVFKSVMALIACLGGAATVMGFVSGTFFGIELLETPLPLLKKFHAVILDQNQLFYNALLMGVIQIVFGMFVKFLEQVRRKGFSGGIATLGWLILIVGAGGTAAISQLTTILSPELTKYLTLGFVAAGGLCVLLLNNLKRNPLVNIGAGLWDTYNMVTGLLGDVLSYIRLFALGLSGSVMGLVFNDLALTMGGDIEIPVVSQLVAIVILLFGHSINIFIAVLGSFVHPMRLTFVEFYKNAGFEGGGKKYRPFAKYKEETKVL